MCGIAGYISRNLVPITNTTIKRMTDIISHRGPDDEGFFFLTKNRSILTAGGHDTPIGVWQMNTNYRPDSDVNKLAESGSVLAIGHRRLSILDLSPAGHQPMSSNNGRYWIVYNGEIYNYLLLRKELEAAGHVFNTNTDTEVILAAYSFWGENCLNKLVGMWAFAIYDKVSNEIFLSRDRYGIKPLYYYFSATGDFYFSSEIKQFTQVEDWQSNVNPDRVYDQLIYSFIDHTDETMFRGVFHLPAGAFYKHSIDNISPNSSGRISTEKWYNVIRTPFSGSFEEASIVFRELFNQSVKEHLNADVPIGTALSGGLDSSSIVCEINRQFKKSGIVDRQRTFSSCAYDERFSERKWMDIVVNHTGVESNFMYPTIEDVIEQTEKILWHQDEPYQSQSTFLAYNVFKHANSKGIKVLMNGQGADEYLGGYGQFTVARYSTMLKRLQLWSILNDFLNSNSRNKSIRASVFFGMLLHLFPTNFKRRLSRINSSSDVIKNIVDGKMVNTKTIHPYDIIPVQYSSVPEISMHLTFYSTLPKYLHWEDRNSMAHSVEARVPFLDHRLVEFCYNLPDEFLEKDGVNKRVMRSAMNGLLPDKIINRRDKMGFSTPEEIWVKQENPAYFRNKIAEAIETTNGIIKPSALRYFDNLVNDRVPFDYSYWRIIMFSEWVRLFSVKL